MTCSFLFLTGKMSISSVFVTMLAFNLAVFPCPLFHKLKAQGAEKTADFLQFRHEALSSVACPIPLSLIHGYVAPAVAAVMTRATGVRHIYLINKSWETSTSGASNPVPG